mgnify:CR=1 FL=1
MKVNIGANIGPINIDTEININSIKQKISEQKEKINENKIKKYKFCFYIEQTGCVTEYAVVETSIKEVRQKINDVNLTLKAMHPGSPRLSISKFFNETQIISKIEESNGFDGIEKEDFDISIGF